MILQALLDGVLNGAIIALGAIGVTFSLAILRFANFSHGDLLAVGAYAALFVLVSSGIGGGSLGPFSFGGGMIAALLAAIALTVVVALLLDRWVFRRLRARGAEPLTMVFASFGLALVLRSLLHLMFGPDPYNYSTEIQMAIRLPGAVLVMPDQVFVFIVAVLVMGALWFGLYRTRHGIAMRAVAESPALAGVAGVDTTAIIRLTWVVSTALAALAGVLYGITVQVRPEMGANLLLPLFTAAILGGVGSVGGAVAGALLISLSESLVTLVVPTGYRPLVPFVLLLAVLFIRPVGLFVRAGRAT